MSTVGPISENPFRIIWEGAFSTLEGIFTIGQGVFTVIKGLLTIFAGILSNIIVGFVTVCIKFTVFFFQITPTGKSISLEHAS
jgi:hypothetical protein